MSFQIVKFKEQKKWDGLMKGQADVYYQHGYAASFLSVDRGAPELWIFETEKARVFQVVVVKDIAQLPCFSSVLHKQEFFDASTPYGYGGPAIQTKGLVDISRIMKAYSQFVEDYCRSRNIICEFIRFHPLLQNHLLLGRFCELRYSRKTVLVNLAGGELLSEVISGEKRRNIRRALRNDITVAFDLNADKLDEFYEIYVKTMQKNQADEYYFFPFRFFKDTMQLLRDQAVLISAYDGSKMISGGIFLMGEGMMHCHFSATDPAYLHLNANSLIVYKAAEWGQKMNLRTLHLGGGHSEEADDSLYRFKKSFSTGEPLDFYTGKKIYHPGAYEEIARLSGKHKEIDNENYFPVFRAK
ncbi:MAG: GNAT family N-acetyltransferase [Eubacteriales bacterium]